MKHKGAAEKELALLLQRHNMLDAADKKSRCEISHPQNLIVSTYLAFF